MIAFWQVPHALIGRGRGSVRSRYGPQRESQILSGLKPPRRILFQAPLDDLPHSTGNRGRKLRRIALEDGTQYIRGRLAIEGTAPAEKFIDNRTQAENIGARVCRVAAGLLGDM